MATSSEGRGKQSEPSLPPSPMAAEETGRVRPLRFLPWWIPVATAVAGAVAGFLWHYWYAPTIQVPVVRYVILGAAVMGLGPCLADRLLRWRWRVLPWALGTATALAVVLARVFVHGAGSPLHYVSPPSLHWFLPEVGAALLRFAAPGALFGLLAGRRWSRWLMPLGGLVLTALLHRALYPPSGNWHFNPSYCGSLAAVCCGLVPRLHIQDRPLVCDAVLGLLLGLAFAVADWRAVEREPAP